MSQIHCYMQKIWRIRGQSITKAWVKCLLSLLCQPADGLLGKCCATQSIDWLLSELDLMSPLLSVSPPCLLGADSLVLCPDSWAANSTSWVREHTFLYRLSTIFLTVQEYHIHYHWIEGWKIVCWLHQVSYSFLIVMVCVINQVWPRVVLDYLSMHGASNNYRNVKNMMKLLTKVGSYNHVILVEVKQGLYPSHQWMNWHGSRLNKTFSYKPNTPPQSYLVPRKEW